MVVITRTGLVQGGSDAKATWLPKFAAELLGYASDLDPLSNIFMMKDCGGATSVRFRRFGRIKGFSHTPGNNLTVQAEDGSKFKKFAQNYVDVKLDNQNLMVGTVLPEVDVLMSPAGAQDRAMLREELVQSATTMKNLRIVSMMVQAIATTDTISPSGTPSSRHISKATAAKIAGLTDGSGGTNSYGYHIDALASGAAVYSALMKLNRYFRANKLRKKQWYVLISSAHLVSLIEDCGDKVSYSNPSGGTAYPVVPALSKSLNGTEGNGSIIDVTMYKCAGFRLIECDWLTGSSGTGLGTNLEDWFTSSPGGAGFGDAEDEKKYQPTDGAGTTVGGNIQIKQNNGGGEAGDWAAHKSLMDKIALIAFCDDLIAGAKLYDDRVEGDGYNWQIQGYPLLMKNHLGWGPLCVERGAYVATAKG